MSVTAPFAPLVSEATVKAFVSCTLIAPPVNVTAPPKSFVAVLRVMLFAPALMFEVPVTASVPVWLTAPPAVVVRLVPTVVAPKLVVPAVLVVVRNAPVEPLTVRLVPATSVLQPPSRSEERRVGKAGRSRWAPYHLKKKW